MNLRLQVFLSRMLSFWFVECLVIILNVIHFISGFKQFDDSVMFKLGWPGDADAPEDLLRKYKDRSLLGVEAVVLSSVDNERYLCSLPHSLDMDRKRQIEYFGKTPHQLLLPLYQQRSCTYRIEMYWTYELCHGRYLLQYHEEKDISRKTKRQEYYLGQYMADTVAEEEEKLDTMNPPKRKIEDQMLPYYPVRYVQGTICDITKKPRMTTVLYICMSESKNQIYSFEEVSSCDYEVVVLTPTICPHPAFRVEEAKELNVECFPIEGSPPRPTALTVWEQEQKWEKQQQHRRLIMESKDSFRQSPSPQRKQHQEEDDTQNNFRAHSRATPPSTDAAMVQSFLAGEYCLYGGSGWWKHEYCHGRQVIQFHEDSKTERIEVQLGLWNEEKHLEWIAEKPHKKPLKVDGKIRQVSHLYSGGDICDLTRRPRFVEVRLRCRETKGNSNAVTLYLLEPKSCEYILGVESQMFCDLLQTADENGLLKKRA